MKDIIRLITNESGDWEVLLLNGNVYEEGHDIPTYTWINLIRDLGHEAKYLVPLQTGWLVGWCPVMYKFTPFKPKKRPDWCPLMEVQK